MTIPYPIDPSLPSNPNPLFSDAEAVRGDHMRANNDQIWDNTLYIVNTILAGAVLSTDGTMAANSDLLFPSEKAVRAYIAAYINAMLPIGSEMYWPGPMPPTNWIVRNGSSLSKVSYASLWSAMAKVTSGLTMTLANPCVLTLNNHGLQTYQCVSLETTGSIPSNLAVDTNYYVHVINANTFHLCTSIANVKAGTYIGTLSGTQSGIHSLRYSSYGLGATGYFKLPDDRGIHIVGTGIQGTATDWAGTLSNHVGVQGYYNEDGAHLHWHGPGPGSLNFRGTLAISGEFMQTRANGSFCEVAITTTGNMVTDTVHGTPRGGGLANAGYITSPARVGHLPIIKYQ